MSQSNKNQLPSGKRSTFAQACEEAHILLDLAGSQNPPPFETVLIGRRKMRLAEVLTDLNAARARVEAYFAQPTMEADAIRRRICSDPNQEGALPFSVMTGRSR